MCHSPTPNSSKGLIVWCEPCFYMRDLLHFLAIAHKNTSVSSSSPSHFSKSVLGFYSHKTCQTFTGISRVNISKYVKWGYIHIFMLAHRKWKYNTNNGTIWPLESYYLQYCFEENKFWSLTWDGKQASSGGLWGGVSLMYHRWAVDYCYFLMESYFSGLFCLQMFWISLLKSGLQPHTGSAKVPWVLDWQLYAWKLSELHPTSRWLSFKKDTGWWPHSIQGDGGWSVSSSTAWEYFLLALHKVCALGVQDEAESMQTNSIQWRSLVGVPQLLSLPVSAHSQCSCSSPKPVPVMTVETVGPSCLVHPQLLSSCLEHTPLVPDSLLQGPN